MVITTPRKPYDECFDPLIFLLPLSSLPGEWFAVRLLSKSTSMRKDLIREGKKRYVTEGSVTGRVYEG